MISSLGSAAACDAVARDAYGFLDGELSGDAAADLALHVERCASCRRRLDGERRFRARLRRLGSATPAPRELRGRVGALLAAWTSPLTGIRSPAE
jgi:anti-sigma factor (TIGR02949 family)